MPSQGRFDGARRASLRRVREWNEGETPLGLRPDRKGRREARRGMYLMFLCARSKRSSCLHEGGLT